MPLQVPYEGEQLLLDRLRSYWNGTGNSCMLCLYQSAHTFDPTDELADYQAIECDYEGYSPIGLNGWGTPAVPDGDGRAYVGDILRTFTPSGTDGLPQTVYGYFVCDLNDGILLWAEELPTPITLTIATDFVAIIPKFTTLSEF